MAFSSLFSLNLNLISYSTSASKNPFPSHSYLPLSSPHQLTCKRREFPLPSVASIPYEPINVDYLEEEFSGHGVRFERLDDSCIAKMKLDNGSTATLMLPSGLITSYKPQMWHGGTTELLQTSVMEGADGSAVIQGGVSIAFNFESDGDIPWSPSSWNLHDIRGNSHDSIQVELVSADAMNMVEVRHILSLREDELRSELVVRNSRASPVRLTGSVISHLTVSTPEATYAIGLEGSDFFSRPMFLSNFSIVPPDPGQENGIDLGKMFVKGLFSGWGATNQNNVKQVASDEEMEGEEEDNYKQLTEKMSRIYISAPSDFMIIDRGRRNSVIIGRNGFDELYMFSPGSSYDSYDKYSYISVGQSAMLKPVTLSPGAEWIGGQFLHNPNT